MRGVFVFVLEDFEFGVVHEGFVFAVFDFSEDDEGIAFADEFGDVVGIEPTAGPAVGPGASMRGDEDGLEADAAIAEADSFAGLDATMKADWLSVFGVGEGGEAFAVFVATGKVLDELTKGVDAETGEGCASLDRQPV